MAVFNHMSLNPRFFLGVEHNQFKKGPAFLWHLTIEYGPKSYDKDKKDRTFIDTLLVYTLWYDFWNDFDAQSDLEPYFSEICFRIRKFFTPWPHHYIQILKGGTNSKFDGQALTPSFTLSPLRIGALWKSSVFAHAQSILNPWKCLKHMSP